MAAASVTFCPVRAMAGLTRSISAGGYGLNFKKAVQKRKVSSKVGVNSVILRPKATWIGHSDRCMDVLKLQTQAPPLGTMKKVSGHNGFNRPICATGPGSEGNEPEELGEEPSEGTCDDHHAHHEDLDNAPDSTKEELSLDEFKQFKMRIYKEYTEDHLSDGDAFAEPRDQAEIENEINGSTVIVQLEDLLRKASNAEALRPELIDLVFVGFLMLGYLGTGLSITAGALSEPFAHLLRFLLPAIKELYGNAIIEELRKFNS